MQALINDAKELIVEFKGNDCAFGTGVLDGVGSMTAEIGKRALLVSRPSSAWPFWLKNRMTWLPGSKWPWAPIWIPFPPGN